MERKQAKICKVEDLDVGLDRAFGPTASALMAVSHRSRLGRAWQREGAGNDCGTAGGSF